MNRRTRFTRRASRNHEWKNSYSLLENRLLLAGDVAVFDDGSFLRVIGDSEDNLIEISQNENGETVVTGIDTTINGLNTPHIESRFFLNLTVEAGAGDDDITVIDQNVTRNVRIIGEQGNDRISVDDLTAYYLHIDGEQGNDIVELEDSFLRKSTYVFLGDGDDVLAADNYVSGRNFKVFGEEGNDTFAAGDFAVGRKLRVNLDNGDDNVLFIGEGDVNRTAKIRAGSGDDFVGILPAQNTETIRFRRRLSVDGNAGSDTIVFDSNVTLNRSSRVAGGPDADVFDVPVELANIRDREFETFQVSDLDGLIQSVFDTLAAADIPTNFFDSDIVSTLAINLDQTTLRFSENGEAIAIDAGLELTGPGDENITQATVSLSGFQVGQDALSFTGDNGISASFDDQSGILTLSGNGSIIDYQTALREVWYENTSDNPLTDERTINVEITTEANEIVSASRPLEVLALNDAPVITFSRETVAVDLSDLPLTLDEQLEVQDVDSSTLNSAVVSITTGFEAGFDELNFEPINGVIGTFDPSTGALTFAGEGTLDEYQSLLQTVRFEIDGIPTGNERTIRFTINDGELNGFAEFELNIVV